MGSDPSEDPTLMPEWLPAIEGSSEGEPSSATDESTAMEAPSTYWT